MMQDNAFTISKHATIRARQRGYRQYDMHFVIKHGTEVPDGYLLRRQDVERIACEDKLTSAWPSPLFERAMRLEGTFIAVGAGKCVTSVYRPQRSKLKHLLRHQRGGLYPNRRGRR